MAVSKVLRFLYLAVTRLYNGAINNHGNVFFLILNFCINFSPVFLWLTIFKNAGIIPHEWRPTIHVKLVYYMDMYFYALNFVGLLCGAAVMGFGYFLYTVFFKVKTVQPDQEFIPLSEFEIGDLEDDEVDENTTGSANDDEGDDDEDDLHIPPSGSPVSIQLEPTKNKFNHNYPPGYSPVLIVLLFALSWPILNFDYFFAQPEFITKSKDIIAWVFYVLCHLIAPISTAVYLYVFQAPGALMYFSCILGLQNISGVITHLLFPNAPPWFIHLNGLDVVPDYEMPGFAAGLTRVDVAMGTHLNSKGFHKSPIVFGAFPSLHSAMAVQVFIHLNYYSKWWAVKFLGLAFVVIQWWATIYLDHHFRMDLFFGMIYAYAAFIVFQRKLWQLQRNFHSNYFLNKNILGTTMGMRVFKNTFLERFFVPYNV